MWWNSDSKQSHTHMLGRSRTQKSVPMQYAGFYLTTFLQPVKQWYHETWSAGLLWLVIVPMKIFFSVHDNCVWILNFRFWSNSIDQNNPESWHGVTLIELLCTFTSKDYLYLKNKFQEATEKNINALYKEMQGYYSNFKYWNLKKTLKINQSNPVSR